jgi:hypothetical protein
MLRTEDLTPEVYYKESRDFQYFGRLYDVIFNYIKCNVDLMKEAPYNNMETLLLNTFGFHHKTNETNESVKRVAENLTSLFREKGTTNCIKRLFTILATSENIDEEIDINDTYYYDAAKTIKKIIITLPPNISFYSLALAEKLLNYLLPVGCVCDIQKSDIERLNKETIYTSEKFGVYGLTKNRATSVRATGTDSAMNTTLKTGETLLTTNPTIGDIRFSKVTTTTTNDTAGGE